MSTGYSYFDYCCFVMSFFNRVAAAEKEVAEVMAVLRQKQQKLAEVEAHIAKLEATYDASVSEKAELESTMLQCSQRLNRAGRLTTALEDEQVRWEQSVEVSKGICYFVNRRHLRGGE